MMIFGVVTAELAKGLAETLPSHDRWKVFEDVVARSGVTLYMSDDKKVIRLQGMWQSLKNAHDLLEREYGACTGNNSIQPGRTDGRGRKSAAYSRSQRISSVYLKPSKSTLRHCKKWPKAPEPVVIFEKGNPKTSGTAEPVNISNKQDVWNTQFLFDAVSSGSTFPETTPTTSSGQLPMSSQTSTQMIESLHQNYNLILPEEMMPTSNGNIDSSKFNENSSCMTIPEAIQIAINAISNDDVEDVDNHPVNNVVDREPKLKATPNSNEKRNSDETGDLETKKSAAPEGFISKDKSENKIKSDDKTKTVDKTIKPSVETNRDQQTDCRPMQKVSDEDMEGDDNSEHKPLLKRSRRKRRPPVRTGTVQLTDEHVKRKRGRPRKTEPTVVTLNCPDCDFIGKNKIDLRNHKQRFHAGSETGCFKCPVCEKQFSFEKDMKRHMTRHVDTRYPCDVCGKIYKDEKTMLKHKERHKEGWVRPVFPCNQCSKSFCTKFILNNHIMSAHLGQKRMFLCPTCGKSFTQKHVYLEHANIHLGIKPFVCDICNKAFAYEKSLKEHRFVHFEEKRFVCQVCSKAFRQKSILIVHSKIHKPVKDFICRVCNKGFTQKQALLRHERVHNNEKPVHFNL